MDRKKLIQALLRPQLFINELCKHFPAFVPDRLYIKTAWNWRMPYALNLDYPVTYNEKLQWMKLYDRNPLYTRLVDKYEVKNYVANIIGSQYIIPTIGVYSNFKNIDFDMLPQQFVLKCTHDSGGLVICKDKSKLNLNECKKKIGTSLKRNYFLYGREWPYKNVKRRIIAEKYMEDKSSKDLNDYKFFCFNGVPLFLFIATERFNGKGPFTDFFDMDFNHLNFERGGHKMAPITPQKPRNFDKMKEIAARLSEGLPHVRVDLYDINGMIYFGELTLYPGNGTEPFDPLEWDYEFGKHINLPQKRKQ